MQIGEIYKTGGDYLKAEDLQGKARMLTIASAEAREFDDDNGKKLKVVLGFQGTDRQLVLNVTNANMIAETYGTETNDWKGKAIELRPTRVQFGSKMVDAIRVFPPAQAQGTPAQAFQAPPPVQQQAAVALDDDLPF